MTACSADVTTESLIVSIVKNNGGYYIADFHVVGQPYKKSAGQQGTFRVHLIDKGGKVFKKIGFGKLNISSTEKGNPKISFMIPLTSKLEQIAVYKLDGSSGHYRLDSAHPLIKWTLPDSLQTAISK